MNVEAGEALTFLNRLRGSFVFAKVRVNYAAHNDPSIGVVRFDSEVLLESCDAESLSLTWKNGRIYVALEGASFSFPDPEQTAPVAMEIRLPDGVKCVICPAKR
jgi:hypothetical protein